jgi:beta-glucosidase-like glycosyl hydrolase
VGVSARAKHYASTNQEEHRNDIDVNMSGALREIYLPALRAAVQEGGGGGAEQR